MWARVVVVNGDEERVASWTIGEQGRPDMRAVDGLARVRLAASHRGWAVRLEEVGPELAELLELAGLSDLLL